MDARTLVTRALRRGQLIEQDETPTPGQAEEAVAVLNDLLFAWETDGIHLGHTTLTLDSEVELPDNHLRGVQLLLALDLAPFYDKTEADFGNVFIAQADRAKRQLMAEYNKVPKADFDRALLDFQANRKGGRYNINNG